MSLAENLNNDVKNALKEGDKKKLSISRYLFSELKNFLIKENLDRDLKNVSDDNFIKILKTQIKQKKESLEFAEKAANQEKIAEIKYDIEYLSSYLPNTLNEEQTQKVIIDYITANNFSGDDFGKIMALIKKNYASSIEMSLASKIIKNYFKE